MRHIFSILALAGIIVTLTACSSPPYVYKAGEFNRASAGFGQPVSDISTVTICYSSYAATPQQVTQLAVDECAAYNKTAVFLKQSHSICPLATPTAAIYTCEGVGGYGENASGQTIPGGILMNYDGIPFRY